MAVRYMTREKIVRQPGMILVWVCLISVLPRHRHGHFLLIPHCALEIICRTRDLVKVWLVRN